MQNQADVCAQIFAVNLLNIHAADGDFAARGRIQPLQQVHHGGFAAARAAQHCRRLARGDGEGHVAQHRHVVIRISEGHMVKHNIAVQVGLQGVRLIRLGFLVQNRLHALHRDHCFARVGQSAAQLANREEQHPQRGGENNQRTDGNPAVAGVDDADHQRQQRLRHADGIAAAPVDGKQFIQAEVLFAQIVVHTVKLLLALLLSEGAHDADAGEVLLQNGVQHTVRFVRHFEGLMHHFEEPRREAEQRRHKNQAVERNRHGARQQDAHGDNDHQHRVDDFHHLNRQKAANRIHVRRAALNQLACLRFNVVRKRQVLQMAVEVIAQFSGDIFTRNRGGTSLNEREHAVDDVHQDERQRGNPQILTEEIASAEGVNRVHEEIRHCERLTAQYAVHDFGEQQRR